ncbi:Fatty acid hydroxylase superfamily [Geosmithia morbida]|uniref:Fatty acid hydroxylase superfamily n=1 Tax=Geosmithia morbida TaxID=1094350 RepID=A0A9P4YUY7_9HYPO|nr:Fatty acid hydroxylase superfamily [Geosmithia morbida]KAF4122259.1 Fatty acid hydroxylase superfamily [Geosmithia morbida]
MDLILSIPLLSTLATPSWQTSLNILFFYTTWSTLVLTQRAPSIHSASLLVLRIALWLVPSLIFTAFDTLLPSLASNIKLPSAASPCPPRLTLQRLSLPAGNMLLVTATESIISFTFYHLFGNPLFRTATTLPLPWQMVRHMALVAAAREILTYYIHRFILHDQSSSSISGPLSRLHLAYAHEGRTTWPLQLYDDHPLPLLVYHLVPTLLPCLLLRPHLLTYILLTALWTLEGTLVTSGYSVVPGIMLGGMARRTAAHYAGRGAGNFGPWGVLDWAHGTSRGGDVVSDAKDEADKHNVKEKSAAKVDRGASDVSQGLDALRDGALKRSNRNASRK